MGLIKNIVLSPFRFVKKRIVAVIPKDEAFPVVAYVKTDYPDPFRYYYEGHDTSYVKGVLIVWKRGIKEKEKEAVLKELQTVL